MISALSEERDEIDADKTRDILRARVGTGVLAAVAATREKGKENTDSSRLRDGAGAVGPNVISKTTVRACPTGYLPGRPSVNLRTGMGHIVQHISCLPSKVTTTEKLA